MGKITCQKVSCRRTFQNNKDDFLCQFLFLPFFQTAATSCQLTASPSLFVKFEKSLLRIKSLKILNSSLLY